MLVTYKSGLMKTNLFQLLCCQVLKFEYLYIQLFLSFFQFHFEEVDITENGNHIWFEKYQYEIPVFHLNGSFLMKHRVNEELLEKELKRCESK